MKANIKQEIHIFPDPTKGEIVIGTYGPSAPLVDVLCIVPGCDDDAKAIADAIARAIRMAPATVRLLGSFEWCWPELRETCPVCRETKDDGHRDCCELRRVLDGCLKSAFYETQDI